MSTLLIYAHLAVVFLVGTFFLNLDKVWLKAFGVLNATLALVYAYGYAVYNLWVMCR